jgi:hypothetical protein
MGNILNRTINPVNYNCPNCMGQGKEIIPNIAGRFFIINDTQCQCNGCNTVYPKSQFYKQVINNAQPL